MATRTVAGCFRDKSILITGSTGFLGKLLVEKILRVQPDIKKLYLLVRAPDAAAAKKRVYSEIVENDLFSCLRKEHGANFYRFIDAKINPIAGDIVHVSFGCDDSEIQELAEKIDVIINGAATTKFYERYDIALATNALGVSYLLQFAKKCPNLKMFLHISTVYVLLGENEGVLLEQPLKIPESRKQRSNLDIEAEVLLIDKLKSDLRTSYSQMSGQIEKGAMKDLGMKRANYFGWQNTYALTKALGEIVLAQLREDLPVVIIRPSIIACTMKDPVPGWIEGIMGMDTFIMGYGDQTIPCFVGDRNSTVDVIPGDMVVNAIMVAVATHWNKNTPVIYHVSSSHENRLSLYDIMESMYRYFASNGFIGNNATRKHKPLLLFSKYTYFIAYTFIAYKLPIEVLHILNLLTRGPFSQYYNVANKNYSCLMILIKMFTPYLFFKGRFGGTNLTKLQTAAMMDYDDAHLYNFDPKCIDWASYFLNIHIPAIVNYAYKKKGENF